MKNFKVGLQLYSVHDIIGKDVEGTLKAIKDIPNEDIEYVKNLLIKLLEKVEEI